MSSSDVSIVCPDETCKKSFVYDYTDKIGKNRRGHKDCQLKNMEAHSSAKHTKIGTFLCKDCDKSFNSEMAINYHSKQHKSKLHCDICQHFIVASNFDEHISKCVKEKFDFSCQYCNKHFGRKKHLEIHELTHFKDKPFQCNSCPRSFVQKGNLKTHNIRKHF